MEQLQTAQQIFSDKLLRVPDYQRGYAWEKTQWNDLIEDLELLQNNQEHYTGTLVLRFVDDNITDEDAKKLKVYEIVDGQQRMTTIVILMHSISKALSSFQNRAKLSDGIRKNFVIFRDIYGQDKARLTLNRECHDYFMKKIVSLISDVQGPLIKSHERLEEALKYFDNYLDTKRHEFESHFDEWLIALHLKITNSMKFTVYEVPDTSEVGVIFEVMNNRGKPLSEMEKVKNYLLYLASKLPNEACEELGAYINNNWGEIFRKLMDSDASSKENEDQLLRFSWLMGYNPNAKEWEGYTSIKSTFALKKYPTQENKLKLRKEIKEYVDVLSASCAAYCDMVAPNRDGAYAIYFDLPEIKKTLISKTEKLKRIGNLAPFIPVIMAARIKYPKDSSFHEGLLDICEKYAFRIYRLNNSRSNTGQFSLFQQGHKLFKGEATPQGVLSKIKALLLNYSSPENYLKELAERVDWYQFYGLKYFLYEYEEYLAKGKGVQLPWEKLVKKDKQESIEHILPQAPDRPYWRERWNAEQIARYTHDIGNLTLTFDNSVYGNKSFPDKKGESGKKDCYANSNLFQEKELAHYADWTLKEEKERRNNILNWAMLRWDVIPGPVDEFEVIEDEILDQEVNDVEDNGDESTLAEGTALLISWKQEEIVSYFNYLKDHNWIWSFLYFKVLAISGTEIGFDELIKKIKELSGKDFTGRQLAGVMAGITRSTDNKGRERLDHQFEDNGWKYSLNKKYEDAIRLYFQIK